MNEINVKNRSMFVGDNLAVLNNLNSECVDLIYLDPPFNSNRHYSAPIGSKAAGASFKDAWTLDDIDDAWIDVIAAVNKPLADLIGGIGKVSGKGDMSYLIFMARRLIEMHRVLKSTGSIYLHIDSTMSHGLKLLMDSIFGKNNFRNEIIWRRTEASKSPGVRFGNVTDSILFYVKSKDATWNDPRIPIDTSIIPKGYKKDDDGRYYRTIDVVALPAHGGDSPRYTYKGFTPKTRWLMTKENLKGLDDKGLLVWSKQKRPYRKQYLDSHPGTPMINLWIDIKGAGHMPTSERTGFPTQKPLALLERVINASSKKGDVVFDPFCGCATACVAAERFDRQWIGCDLSDKSVNLIHERLKKEEILWKRVSEGRHIITRTDFPVRTDIAGSTVNLKKYRKELYGNQGGYCVACKKHFEPSNMHVDHITPKRKGGQDNKENLQLLCAGCNIIKGDRDMLYLLARLKEGGAKR